MRVPRVPRVRQSASLPRRADSATPRRSRRRRGEDVESAKARTRVPASVTHKSAPHESAPPHTTSAPTHSTPEPSVAYVLDGARRLRWRRRSRSRSRPTADSSILILPGRPVARRVVRSRRVRPRAPPRRVAQSPTRRAPRRVSRSPRGAAGARRVRPRTRDVGFDFSVDCRRTRDGWSRRRIRARARSRSTRPLSRRLGVVSRRPRAPAPPPR